MVWQSLRRKAVAWSQAFYAKSTAFDITCIVLFVLCANVLLLSGFFNNNPVNVRSGLLAAGTSSLLSGQYTIDPNDGYTTQALGVGAMKQLLHGHLPWWNHYEQVGAPLAGGMQSAALFPLTILLLAPDGYMLFRISLELLAGIGTYLVLKRLGCSRKAALVGAAAFSLNGTFAWLTNAAANPVALLPWLVLGVERIFSATTLKKPFGFGVFALSLALSIYAGFPETAFINCLFIAVWSVVRLFQLRDTQSRLIFVRKLVAGSIAGVFVAAPIVVAFITYLPYANTGIHSGVNAAGGLTIIGLPALLFPYVYGPIFGYANADISGRLSAFWGSTGGFVTMLTVFLAGIGLLNKKHRILVVVLLAWALIVIGKIFNLPVFNTVVGAVPGISHTAFYRYVPPSLEFGLVIAMALGLDYLFKAKLRLLSIKTFLPALVIVLGLLSIVLPLLHTELQSLKGAPHAIDWAFLSIAWGLGSVLFVVVWITVVRFKTSYIISCLVVIEVLLFFFVPQLSSTRRPTIDMGPVRYLQEHSVGYRFYALGTVQANYGTYWQIASINTNNLPIAKDWTAFVSNSLDDTANPIVFTGANASNLSGKTAIDELLAHLDAYEYVGVKYVVSSNNPADIARLSAAGLGRVYADKLVSIFATPNPQPYVSAANGMCDTGFAGLDVVRTKCAATDEIIRRELYMPGWRAADQSGKQLTVTKEGPLFQSVKVDETTKQVTFYFEPPHMKLAYLVFVLGVGMVVCGPLVSRYRGRSRIHPKRLK